MTTSVRESFRRHRYAIGEFCRNLLSRGRVACRRWPFSAMRRQYRKGKRVLILDELLPEQKFGAGFPRAAELLQAILDAGWHATVYPMRAARSDYVGVRKRFPERVRFLRSYGEQGLRRVMRESIGRFDAVLISRPTLMDRVARMSASLPDFATSAYCIYDAEAAFAAREWRRRALFGPPMSEQALEVLLNAEVAMASCAHAVISVTEAEAKLFRTRTSAAVHVIGHMTSTRPNPPGFAERNDLLFIGKSTGDRSESPNVDSLIWFFDEIMPLLDTRLALDYRLLIVGLVDAPLVARLASPRVVFVGVVGDLLPLYDRSRVFIAPTRYAAGLPLKVVDAAAAGIPCVVTELLADQLCMRHGVDCLVASDAEGFADRCAELYANPECWLRVRDAALSRVATEYSREAFSSSVRHLLETSVHSA